ncbi:hypothetical protein V6N13_036413 [Hibiscus sabdariffa]|uniref:Uncharacterized protein n=1 Tax=Hibiscus sabdariffa TaxID=183260 RepID=A0ABR2S786_9ROSI
MGHRLITVDINGLGHFRSVQDAVESVPENNRKNVEISISAGYYNTGTHARNARMASAGVSDISQAVDSTVRKTRFVMMPVAITSRSVTLRDQSASSLETAAPCTR